MKKVKRVLALMVILVFVATTLTACGDDKPEETKGQEEINDETKETEEIEETEQDADVNLEPVTLLTVSMHGGTDPNAEVYQAINQQFMDDNSHITIEDDSQSADQDWKTKVAADFAVGNEPDVIQYFTDANASDVLAADKFVSIEEIKAEYPEYAGDTLEVSLEAAANPDGVQRAVPTTGYWEGLFCNKDLFDQYNLELPTTWDNLVTAIETFRENDIDPIAVSLNSVPHYWIEFLMLSAAGSEEFSTVPELAPAKWVEGLEYFKTLRDKKAFPLDTDTVDNDFVGEAFKNKEAAMQLDGSWFLGGITDQDNTVVCSFPVLPGGEAEDGFMVGGISSGFYITKKAWEDPAKRDAAVAFVMAHTNKDSVQKYWGGNGQAATIVEPVEDMTPLAISGMEYSNAATSISAPTDSRISQEAYNTLVAGIVDVSTGAKTAEDLLNEVLDINNK